MRAPLLLSSTLVIGLFVACGGGNPDPKTAGPEGSTSASASSAAPVASSAEPVASTSAVASVAPSASATAPKWDGMGKEERINVMKTMVMPKMGELFKAHDGKKFKEITCKTCHGPGAKDGNFKMPNAGLPKLNAKDGFKKHMDKAHADITKFMMTKVVPEMAGILGKPVYDPATHTGFGCGGCHVME